MTTPLQGEDREQRITIVGDFLARDLGWQGGLAAFEAFDPEPNLAIRKQAEAILDALAEHGWSGEGEERERSGGCEPVAGGWSCSGVEERYVLAEISHAINSLTVACGNLLSVREHSPTSLDSEFEDFRAEYERWSPFFALMFGWGKDGDEEKWRKIELVEPMDAWGASKDQEGVEWLTCHGRPVLNMRLAFQRAAAISTQPDYGAGEKPPCETCGGDGRIFASDGVWKTWGGSLGEGGFSYTLKPCPDCGEKPKRPPLDLDDPVSGAYVEALTGEKTVESGEGLEKALAACYPKDYAAIARLCDEHLDPSGALLGRVRNLAPSTQPVETQGAEEAGR